MRAFCFTFTSRYRQNHRENHRRRYRPDFSVFHVLPPIIEIISIITQIITLRKLLRSPKFALYLFFWVLFLDRDKNNCYNLVMDNENKIEELLKPLPIPFTTQLTESSDEFRHSHGFFECFYVTEGSIYHECNGKNETLTEGDAGIICPGVYHRFRRDKSCIHRDLLISNELMKSVCLFWTSICTPTS